MTRSRNIDRILRQMAARDQVTGLDSHLRWARLHQVGEEAQRPRRRVQRRKLVLATSLGLLLIGVMMWQDVGTEDFTLVSSGRDAAGHEIFSGRHRPYSISLGTDSLDTESARRVSEEILAKTEAGGGKLLYIRGTTIKGVTHLIAFSEIQTSNGPQVVTEDVDSPLSDKMTEKSAETMTRFLQTRYSEARQTIKDGRAKPVGSIDIVVGGRVCRCERWEFSYPEFGTVIYWSGTPLP